MSCAEGGSCFPLWAYNLTITQMFFVVVRKCVHFRQQTKFIGNFFFRLDFADPDVGAPLFLTRSWTKVAFVQDVSL